MAYLRTVENGLDDISVKRIINVPKRGIGLTTIDRVADYALTHETSFYGALQNYEYIDGIKRSAGKLGSFVSLIESFKRHLASPEYSLEDLIREIIEETGYVRLLEEEDTEEANGRIENIEEFINKVVTYEENCEEEPTLSGFLEEVALVADIDTVDDDNNMVLLMTLHSAKGLEFPYVYLVGMEDGIFPGYAAVMGDDPEEMEEERRLCYVGITRAKQKLSLSCARSRFRNGEQQYNRPSSFLNEIPRYLLKQNGDAFQDSSRTASSPFSGNSFTESRRQSYHQVRMNELPNVRTNTSSTWDPMAERSAKQAVRRSSGADLFAGNPLIRKGIGSSSQAGDIYRSKGSSLRDSSIFDKGNSGKTTSGTLSYGEGDRIKHKKFGGLDFWCAVTRTNAVKSLSDKSIFYLSGSKCTVSARFLHGFKTCKGCKSLQNRTKGAEIRSSKHAIYRKEITLKRNFQKLRESPGVRYESVGRGFESLPSHHDECFYSI